MFETLSRYWWILVVRGVIALLFGLAAFLMPDITLLALVLLFGAYALLDGVLALVSAIRGDRRGNRQLLLALEGIAGIAAAVITVVWPNITALALLYLIAAWSVITGVLEIAAAIRLREAIQGEWLLGLAGVASVIFGVAVALFPGAGALAVVWLIGSWALFVGILLIALGIRLRGTLGREAQDAPRSGPAHVPVR